MPTSSPRRRTKTADVWLPAEQQQWDQGTAIAYTDVSSADSIVDSVMMFVSGVCATAKGQQWSVRQPQPGKRNRQARRVRIAALSAPATDRAKGQRDAIRKLASDPRKMRTLSLNPGAGLAGVGRATEGVSSANKRYGEEGAESHKVARWRREEMSTRPRYPRRLAASQFLYGKHWTSSLDNTHKNRVVGRLVDARNEQAQRRVSCAGSVAQG